MQKWLDDNDTLMYSAHKWTYKIKDLNGEKIIGSSYEKELSLGNL